MTSTPLEKEVCCLNSHGIFQVARVTGQMNVVEVGRSKDVKEIDLGAILIRR